jgi:hypothetical protein
MDLTKYQTEKELEQDGVWIDGPEGCRVKIRSTDTSRYKRAVAKHVRKEGPQKIRKDPDAQTRVGINAMAEEVIIAWEGVKNKGEDLECTLENRKAFLAVSELRDWIATEAGDIANFQKEGQADDAADVKSLGRVD